MFELNAQTFFFWVILNYFDRHKFLKTGTYSNKSLKVSYHNNYVEYVNQKENIVHLIILKAQ